MRILIITNYVPYPPTSGSLVRIYNLLQHLGRHHEVSLVATFDPWTGKDNSAACLEALCARLELVPSRARTRRERWLMKAQAIWEREPRDNMVYYSREMADKIKALTENEHFDVIDINHLCMAPCIKAIAPTSNSRKILTLHDIAHVQSRRIMSIEPDWRVKRDIFFTDRLFSKQATLKYARRCDKCVVVSESDRDALKQAGPDLDIAVVPNGVNIQEYSLLADQPTTPTFLFVGTMDYPPNVDGAISFCQEIFPLVKQQAPDAKFLIVGRQPARAVQALASEDVIVTGNVESVIPYYQQACASVVPLRAGSGTRLKILESMALGRPVISTTLGCEGLAVTPGDNILIADTPADFAAQALRLLQDQELRRRLIVNGRRLVEAAYDWQAIAQQLLQVYEVRGQ